MTVVMKGGTSGMRQDYLPQIGQDVSLPMLDTSTTGAVPDSIHFFSTPYSNGVRGDEKFTYPMPTGATIPEGSSDVQDQDEGSASPQGTDWKS